MKLCTNRAQTGAAHATTNHHELRGGARRTGFALLSRILTRNPPEAFALRRGLSFFSNSNFMYNSNMSFSLNTKHLHHAYLVEGESDLVVSEVVLVPPCQGDALT